MVKKYRSARHPWLTPIILATQEAEIRRITVLSQPRQTVLKTPYLKNTQHTYTSARLFPFMLWNLCLLTHSVAKPVVVALTVWSWSTLREECPYCSSQFLLCRVGCRQKEHGSHGSFAPVICGH
jgi:hypothetical protein